MQENTVTLNTESTALLSIDLQLYDIEPSVGLLSRQPIEVVASFLEHMNDVVIPNVVRLQDAFRQRRLETLHTRILSMTHDGRDRSKGHKALNLHIAPNDPLGAFIEEVGPVGDELIFNKTASGVFSSTNLDYVLRNLGVESVVICGVYTDECISNAVRTGCDLGYEMILVTDACAAVNLERHEQALNALDQRYCQTRTTDEMLTLLSLTPHG